MKRSYALIGLAVIGAIAIASPAIGGPSLKKLVKKEVRKQLAAKTGPQGLQGLPGPQGLQGLPGPQGVQGVAGTARAYALVRPGGVGGCPPQPCFIFHAKGISSVTNTATGIYCVVAPGIDSADVTPVVSVDNGETEGFEGNTSAMTDANNSCGAGGFQVITERQPRTNVCTTVSGGNCTATATVAGDSVESNTVGFVIVIP